MPIDKISMQDLPAIPISELLEVLLERSRQRRKNPALKIPKVTFGLSALRRSFACHRQPDPLCTMVYSYSLSKVTNSDVGFH